MLTYLVHPEWFGGREGVVSVEHCSELSMGHTVVDWWGQTGQVPNALVLTDIDADAFFADLCERLARYGGEPSMTARPVIIDTDPGVDDAIAILLALASPELEVLGICAVAGNVPLAATRVNARRVCELAGRPDIAVYAGLPGAVAARSNLRQVQRRERTRRHPAARARNARTAGARGRIPVVRPRRGGSRQAREGHRLHPRPADQRRRRLGQRPELAAGIERIVAMGGAFSVLGNRTPSAEFNILADPHAARIVFNAGAPITLAPLDMTFQALATPERIEVIRKLDTPVAAAAAELITYYDRNDPERYGAIGGPLHDPTVIAWLLEPDIFEGRDAWIGIDCESPLTLGHTVVDWWRKTGHAANAHVLTGLDAARFFGLLAERLAALPLS